ncbi:hypothetical protein [Legionella sp. PC997]|uniref:hypothetical protein n=1 Tax=Legionella sp. PC997 TaxID=2755562 RepID=UPI0015F8B928|nr:hypothetical protein [Legionella sp. PC997]QMT60284.1 hypothetical protein HBNCFIEN_01656 [Legionella sp. PC997]
MSGSKEEIKLTSDKLHNKNCFSYLRHVKLPRAVIDLKLLPENVINSISSLQEPQFNVMSQLPQDLTNYTGSYIYCTDQESKKLYFIKSDGTSESVQIEDFDLFDQNLQQMNGKGLKQFNLKPTQIETLITSNGGHLPYDSSYPYADLYTEFFDYLEDNIKNIFDKPRAALLLDRERLAVYLETIRVDPKYLPYSLQKAYVGNMGVLPSIKPIGDLKEKAKRIEDEIDALDEFIFSLYANDNHILEDTFGNIREITLKQNPSSSSIEKSISNYVSDKETPINKKSHSPAYEGSAVGRVTAMMAKEYHPQHGTSLSTIRHYRYNVNGPIEYRFGTQGQRHEGKVRISPLFKRFLKIEAEREEARVEQAKKEREARLNATGKQAPNQAEGTNALEKSADHGEIDEDRITHIYFNLLGRDRTGLEGTKEKELTQKLEALELHQKEDGTISGYKNVAVITLPADKGLMWQKAYADTTTKYNSKNVIEDFLRIAQESKGYDLHLRNKLPEDLTQFQGSYIYCSDDKIKTLYYINADGESKEVPIENIAQFEKNLKEIKEQDSDLIHLTDDQAKSMIASSDHTPPGLMKIKDFHISERIRRKIFKDGGKYTHETEAKVLKGLLDESFKALGYSEKTELTEAERQAVWFHFVKYQLPNHIIESLNPKSINFSCKDAIDRGGVASAYYNLVKSFNLTDSEQKKEVGNKPMSREEFEEALHAAPTMVKGRGMNHHRKLIWNAVDAYVNAHYNDLKNNSDKAWLIEWRDYNCPHERVESLLKQRLGEGLVEIEEHLRTEQNSPKIKALTQGKMILEEIDQQTKLGVSGRRVLLETAVSTTSMSLSPDTQKPENIDRYQKLYDKLEISFPQLTVLRGLLKIFAGTVTDIVLGALSMASFGKIDIKSDLTSRGWATFNTGWDLSARKTLQSVMKNQLEEMKMKGNQKDDQKDPNEDSTLSGANSNVECS